MTESIDISGQLASLKLGLDCVFKASPDLPLVSFGADVDLFSLEPARLLQRLRKSIKLDGQSRLHLKNRTEFHQQLDWIESSRLLVRFDVYSSLPNWQRFAIKPDVFGAIMARTELHLSSGSLAFPKLSRLDESLIRYFEFLEYFWAGPEKPHHWDWILANLSEPERAELYERAHRSIIFSFPERRAPMVDARSPVVFVVERLKSVLLRFPRLRRSLKELWLKFRGP